jgi:hypothetical protein
VVLNYLTNEHQLPRTIIFTFFSPATFLKAQKCFTVNFTEKLNYHSSKKEWNFSGVDYDDFHLFFFTLLLLHFDSSKIVEGIKINLKKKAFIYFGITAAAAAVVAVMHTHEELQILYNIKLVGAAIANEIVYIRMEKEM